MGRRIIDFLVTLLIFCPPLLFAYSYTGPFQWISEAQLAILGQYYEEVSFLLTLLAWIMFCFICATLICRCLGKPVFYSQLFGGRDAIVGRQLPMIVLATVIAFVSIAGYYEYAFKTTHEPMHVDVADVSKNWWHPGTYLSIDHARVDPENSITVEEGVNKTVYLPLLREGRQNGEAVGAYVEVPMGRLNNQPADPALMTCGITTLTGLPGAVRDRLERNGFPPTRWSVLILYGSTPEDLEREAGEFVIIAMIVAVLGGLMLYRVKNHLRSKEAAR